MSGNQSISKLYPIFLSLAIVARKTNGEEATMGSGHYFFNAGFTMIYRPKDGQHRFFADKAV